MADGLPVVIRELEGDLREVVLEDSTLPERGVEVGRRLRTQQTWYPGTQAASTQVMGTEEEPVTLTGWLNDRWLALDGGAAVTKTALEDLCLGQRYCELSWGQMIVAHGFVARTRFKVHNEALIAYEVEFQVAEVHRQEILAIPLVIEGQADPFSVLDQLSDALDLLEDAIYAGDAIQALI